MRCHVVLTHVRLAVVHTVLSTCKNQCVNEGGPISVYCVIAVMLDKEDPPTHEAAVTSTPQNVAAVSATAICSL